MLYRVEGMEYCWMDETWDNVVQIMYLFGKVLVNCNLSLNGVPLILVPLELYKIYTCRSQNVGYLRLIID